jgi:hypothetical protein
MVNRRNFRHRSEVFARVVAWLREQRAPVRRVPAEVADPSIAARILGQLAVRGLVRHLNDGWLPSIILTREMQLIGEDASR